MNWFAKIVSAFMIGGGGIYIFRGEWAAKLDKCVGRHPATDLFYKVEGFILLGFGILYLILFNYLAFQKH